MRDWLSARRSGRVCKPNPDEPTSVLRPSRSTTFGEKRVKEKRRKGLLAAASAAASASAGSAFLCQLMQLQEAAQAAEASGLRGKKAPAPKPLELKPESDDPLGLTTLVAQTMCELESSPAKPKPMEPSCPRSGSDEESASTTKASTRSSLLHRVTRDAATEPSSNTGIVHSGRLSWERAYAFSSGTTSAEKVAPAGATISLKHVREYYFQETGVWPRNEAPQHPDISARGSCVPESSRIGKDGWALFIREAGKPENHGTEKDRAAAHAATASANQQAADAIESDGQGRRKSPPIRCGHQLCRSH
eukprot:COSAG01_NODE_4715_length_4796_cov_2.941665_4_plen_305_part_00